MARNKGMWGLFLAALLAASGCRAFPSVVAGGMGGRLSWVRGQPALVAGGIGGVFVLPDWMLGGAGYSLAKPLSLEGAGDQSDLAISYGGTYLAWSPAQGRVFFPSLGLLAGAGEFSLRAASGSRLQESSTGFFVLEPEAGVNLWLPPFEYFLLSLSYRLALGGQAGGLAAAALDGPQLGLSVLFGPFGFSKKP